jgi:hypothetical protein
MRNELVEELITEGEAKALAEPDGEFIRHGQSGERESEPGSRAEEVRPRRAKKA